MNDFIHRISNTLFIDIETVSGKSTFVEMTQSKQKLWRHKAAQIAKYSMLDLTPQMIEDLYSKKAAIYAEFGKIICISVGMYVRDGNSYVFKTKSYCGDDEELILREFCQLVKTHFNKPNIFRFCGHNIREFDIPYICRRALIKGVKLPSSLNVAGLKHWQIKHLVDTLQLWKFGDYKHYSSLEMMCELFEVPSPKNELNGSMVGEAYWKESDLEVISKYCEQDVEAVAMVYAKMIGKKEFLKYHKMYHYNLENTL